MSEDWKAGDIAVCVNVADNGSAFSDSLARLRVGGIYRVDGAFLLSSKQIGLQFKAPVSTHPDGLWCASHFRKLRPSTQTIDEMIATKRPVRAEERIDG